MRSRLVVTLLATNAVLLAVALGWLTWMTLEPRYWFPSAYATQGPVGDKGPRGEAGPAGPAGPVGPDAADAYDVLETDVVDLVDRADTLEDDLLNATARIEELESEHEQLRAGFGELCSAIDTAYYNSNSATESLLFDLSLACA